MKLLLNNFTIFLKKSVLSIPKRIRKYDYFLFLQLIISLAFGIFAFMKMWERHTNFHSTEDHAIYEQIIWAFTKGKFFYNTNGIVTEAHSFLTDHQMWILPFLAPLYILLPDPMTLYGFQAVTITFASIVLFFLTRNLTGSSLLAVATGISFTGFFILQQAMMFDFRPIALSIPFLLLSFYYFEKDRWYPFMLFFILALSTKESVALTGLASGVYFFIRKKRSFGYLASGVSLLFLFVNLGIIPVLFGKGFLGHAHLRNIPLGDHPDFTGVINLPELLIHRLLSRESWQIVSRFSGHCLYLNLLSPATIISLPYLAYTMASTEPMMRSLYNHYPLAVMAPFFYSVGLGMRNLQVFLKAYSDNFRGQKYLQFAFTLLIAFFLIKIARDDTQKRGILSSTYYFSEELLKEERADLWRSYLKIIPDHSSILSGNRLAAHLAQRRILYSLEKGLRYDVDYILFTDRYKNNISLRKKILSHGFIPVIEKDGFYAYEKNSRKIL